MHVLFNTYYNIMCMSMGAYDCSIIFLPFF